MFRPTSLAHPVLMVLLGASTLGAQSLGEAAAKEKERRNKAKATATAKGTVITEEELRNAKGENASTDVGQLRPSEPPPGREEAADSNPMAAESAVPGANPKRARADQLKGELRQAEAAVRAFERRVAAAQRQVDFLRRLPIGSYVRRGDGGRAQYEAILAQEQQYLKEARARLESLENQARREAIPPGWLR
jgi:hypothetical protein